MIVIPSTALKQLGLDLGVSTKKTRKGEFLAEMERAAPVLAELLEAADIAGQAMHQQQRRRASAAQYSSGTIISAGTGWRM